MKLRRLRKPILITGTLLCVLIVAALVVQVERDRRSWAASEESIAMFGFG